MKKYFFISLTVVLAVSVISCLKNDRQTNDEKNEVLPPGHSLGISSVPNLRDVGGYANMDGKVVSRGKAYRSNQLSFISADDMKEIAALGLKNDYDLRTKEEADKLPDEIPPGVRYTLLDVLADANQASPAMIDQLMEKPEEANIILGGGRIDSMFMEGYREFVTLPSARSSFKQLFLALSDQDKMPLLFHCTTGKDRTGWAAAALLSLLGVPNEAVMKDFLKSNDYIIPMYRKQINAFIAAGGDSLIPLAIFGVKPEYLNASFDEVQKNYGTIEKYFSGALGIDSKLQQQIRERFLR
jgi:protein-tyrosine phosphatase